MNQRTDQRSELSPAPRILSGDVIPSGDQPGAVVHLTPAQLTHLIERAAHPIVLRGPETSPAPYAAPAAGGTGHPGINVTIPSTGGYAYMLPANVPPLAPVPETRTIAPLAFIASAGAFLAGPIVGMLAGSDLMAAILCTVGFAGGTRSLILLLRSER